MAAIDSLPSELNAIYQSTLERIRTQPKEDISLATRAIILLTYAFRSLRITELQHALAVSDDAETFDGDGVVVDQVIVSVCCGLIVVDKESKIVRLVREYTDLYLDAH
jgi:hypothetical protein